MTEPKRRAKPHPPTESGKLPSITHFRRGGHPTSPRPSRSSFFAARPRKCRARFTMACRRPRAGQGARLRFPAESRRQSNELATDAPAFSEKDRPRLATPQASIVRFAKSATISRTKSWRLRLRNPNFKRSQSKTITPRQMDALQARRPTTPPPPLRPRKCRNNGRDEEQAPSAASESENARLLTQIEALNLRGTSKPFGPPPSAPRATTNVMLAKILSPAKTPAKPSTASEVRVQLRRRLVRSMPGIFPLDRRWIKFPSARSSSASDRTPAANRRERSSNS